MTMRRVVVVAGIVLSVAGCGDDGNDANRGWVPADSSGAADEAPQIRVVEVSGATGDGLHGSADAAHEEATHAEMAEIDEAAESDHGTDDADGTDHAAAGSDQQADDSGHDADGTDHVAADTDHEADGSDHDADGSAHEPEASDHDDAGVVAGGTDSDDGGHVVEVSMVEFGYVLDRDTVPLGEPVTFRFLNDGQIEHEAMFGDLHQQEEFASSDGHGDHGSEGHHGEIAAITLDAENAGEMVMVFDTPGEVLIGCHLPGHWDAGMVASFEVVTA